MIQNVNLAMMSLKRMMLVLGAVEMSMAPNQRSSLSNICQVHVLVKIPSMTKGDVVVISQDQKVKQL